jgi:hypothetical protein
MNTMRAIRQSGPCLTLVTECRQPRLAPGRCFHFPEVALDLTVSSHVFVIVFPFRAVVRSQSAKISSGLCSAHPAEALAQLLCEKSRLLEGGEVVALL